MKTTGLIVAGLVVIYIGWKILSFVIFPFIIPIILVGGGYLAYKKGLFKTIFNLWK
jgi:hypothetical protein